MANFLIVINDKDLRYVKDHFIFPHISPFVKIIKHPDLSQVINIPSMFWELRNNMIVEMLPKDKEEKLKLLKEEKKYKNNMTVLYPWYMKLLVFMFILVLCYITWRYNN